ncbi:MAG: flagellar biosynthesis anti-sigma factor FlgM [Thiobacillus sp.]
MKIESGTPQVTLPASIENRPAQAQGNKPATAEQTQVSLSSRAAELKALETQLAAIPVVDRARVDSIKQAISSGQYTINTDNIGDKLIDSVKEMLHVAK